MAVEEPMMRDRWARPLAFSLATAASVVVVIGLGLGALDVSVGAGVGCFDGWEPACAPDALPKSLAGANAPSTDREYLFERIDFEAWCKTLETAP